MSTITLADFGNLMKKVIEPVIQDQLFRDTILLTKLNINKNVKLTNGTFYITALTGRHSGVYSTAEWDTINDGSFATAQMNVKAKYLYGRHTFTDVALEGIEWDAGSIANLLTTATDELKDSIQRTFQRQFSSYGRGVLSVIKTGVTGTTMTVWGRDQTDFGYGTQYLTEWQLIQIGTVAQVEAGTANSVAVATIISDTQFTVDSSITVVAGNVIVNQKWWNATLSAYTEMSGMRNILDNTATGAVDGIAPDTNFQGIARATNNFTNSFIYKPAAYEVLTLERMTEYYLKARKFGKPNLIRTNADLYAKYGALLYAKKGFYNTMQLEWGFEGLEFAGGTNPVPVVLDYDTDEASVEILDTDTFTYGEMAPVGFVDRDGMILRNVGGNSANFTAIMRAYGQLINLKPRGNARLTAMKVA